MSAAIAALILAAGQSRRMGDRNKLLEEIDGKALAVSVADAARSSKARPIIVVTGFESERIETALTGHDMIFTHNPDYAQGMSTSLRRGLDTLPSDIQGVVVCLGDMPHLKAHHINRLIDAFDPVTRPICVPVAGGKRGNPVLWGRQFFEELKAVDGDTGGRDVIHRHQDKVRSVAIEDEAVLLDIDSPEELEKARTNIPR
jgi:molybdenum cofactor cytidylyltransferase